MSAEVETYRFSVEEYHRLGENGFFHEDDRIELLDGELIVMSPIGLKHIVAVRQMIKAFTRKLMDRCVVDCQNPCTIGEFSEPQPDILLLKPEIEQSKRRATPEDILLVVEAAESSLGYDRGRKLRAYAEAGVPEVWILNLLESVIECYRRPEGVRYLEVQMIQREETLACAAFPEVIFSAGELLP